ncbi:Co2+/Mg2+ efflux protein ApaG [Corallococcus sp. EGB]|uniref:Co2+/Mg2+ efflux protein ApaG n=1 Tax=Corallococcus sp. EGB TaxID=1521117 RepID=UPI001CBDAA58|nr:Co2+/Mg2+ efflux protein ApaG [Corallococcus sp. EGB]
MSTATTDGIRVTVEPAFWPERSTPESGQYAFMYKVVLLNEGTVPAQLRSRHWIITDAQGHVDEVKGEGVVGRQPHLKPGERFEYTSWAMLKTPFGTMRGAYEMERPDGTRFEARIAEFALTLPHALH